MIYPKFPKSGDVIGICAPSAGVGGKLDFFELSLSRLHELGFETYETESVRAEDCPSAPAAQRGREFNSLFADPDIPMVICASGGEYTMEMLPYIDQGLFCNDPKWFAGYSDPTSIEMLLTTKHDIATIYGSNAGAWDWPELHEFQENSLSVICGNIPVQHSYDAWASRGYDEELGTYPMEAPVDWTLLVSPEGSDDFEEASQLDVRGRLIGGCTDVLDWIVGTPYEDLKGFAERYKEDGLIWFFDTFEMNPMQLMYAVMRLKQIGLFDNAKAVIFGRVCFPGDATDIDYLVQLERVFAGTGIPVIWGADIGHTKPSMTLINGAVGHLRYESGDATLEMELI